MGRKHAQWRQQRRKRVGTGGEATMPATTPAASGHPRCQPATVPCRHPFKAGARERSAARPPELTPQPRSPPLARRLLQFLISAVVEL